MSELDKMFRRSNDMGYKSIEEFIASGQTLKSRHMRNALNESLKTTFAATPTHGIAKQFIDVVEAGSPFLTAIVPFPRFMYNAMAWQYRFSPLSGMGQLVNIMSAKAIKKEGKSATKEQITKTMIESSIGTAALGAALWYRSNNSESMWYDVGGQDMRPMFPMSQYLIVADVIHKIFGREDDEAAIGSKVLAWPDIFEAITGWNARRGAQSYIMDDLMGDMGNIIDGATEGSLQEKTGEAIGRLIGEYFGGIFAVPRTVKDILTVVDEEYATAKNYNAIEEHGAFDRGKRALWNNGIAKNLPFMDGDIPDRHSGLVEGPMIQEKFSKHFIGATSIPAPNLVQKELTKIGLTEYDLFPPSGDARYDDYMKEAVAPSLLSVVNSWMGTDYYQNLTDVTQKTELVKNVVKQVQMMAREYEEEYDALDTAAKMEEHVGKMDKMWDGWSDKQKSAAVDYKFKLETAIHTGPLARRNWLKIPKAQRTNNSETNQMFREMVANAKKKRDRGEELSTVEYLMTNGAYETVEGSGLYGIGVILSKEIEKRNKNISDMGL